MRESLYDRNYLYLSNEEQEKIKNCSLLIAGCGIGSNIAECAVRLGFENLTIIDGDNVELSNLNRQNYTTQDISIMKADALHARLKSINEKVQIRVVSKFLTKENISSYLGGIQIAVNALDYDTPAPKHFDLKCKALGIPVLHPYNLGWGGLLTIVGPHGQLLEELSTDDNFSEINFVAYAIEELAKSKVDVRWLEEVLQKYMKQENKKSPPQLSVGSWLVAAMCTDIFFRIATGRKIKYFPEFYYQSIKS